LIVRELNLRAYRAELQAALDETVRTLPQLELTGDPLLGLAPSGVHNPRDAPDDGGFLTDRTSVLRFPELPESNGLLMKSADFYPHEPGAAPMPSRWASEESAS
jgi:hypothetical protein